jgi:hypothetical protein
MNCFNRQKTGGKNTIVGIPNNCVSEASSSQAKATSYRDLASFFSRNSLAGRYDTFTFKYADEWTIGVVGLLSVDKHLTVTQLNLHNNTQRERDFSFF